MTSRKDIFSALGYWGLSALCLIACWATLPGFTPVGWEPSIWPYLFFGATIVFGLLGGLRLLVAFTR